MNEKIEIAIARSEYAMLLRMDATLGVVRQIVWSDKLSCTEMIDAIRAFLGEV